MENRENSIGGLHLRKLNRLMISITVVLAVALLLVVLSTNRSFNNLEQATERYVLARKDAADMQAGSDYLTDRVRTFIVTGDPASAEDFFREIEVTRRRDIAMENMEASLSGTTTARYLNAALLTSNQLAEIERYAMRLGVAGQGLDISAMPKPLQEVELTAEDGALTPEEQLSKARELVFDKAYQSAKQTIRDNIARCEEALIGETEAAQKRCTRQLETSLTTQTLLILVVVLVVIAMVLYELRFVSRAYNRALLQSRQNQEQLAYKASHDALTGCFNRGVFEKAKTTTRGRAQAMFIFDIDHFKAFNDTYGHDMGDRVLRKVAQALLKNFRTEDYVCRFGGDEFTVLMVHTTSAMRALVEEKIHRIQALLQDTADGLPPITLSIGVAFSDRPDPTDDILKDADTALYLVKERGKNGYAFYGD